MTDSAIGVKPRQIADWVTDATTCLSTAVSDVSCVGLVSSPFDVG
jgi:hypothetical protein